MGVGGSGCNVNLRMHGLCVLPFRPCDPGFVDSARTLYSHCVTSKGIIVVFEFLLLEPEPDSSEAEQLRSRFHSSYSAEGWRTMKRQEGKDSQNSPTQPSNLHRHCFMTSLQI